MMNEYVWMKLLQFNRRDVEMKARTAWRYRDLFGGRRAR